MTGSSKDGRRQKFVCLFVLIVRSVIDITSVTLSSHHLQGGLRQAASLTVQLSRFSMQRPRAGKCAWEMFMVTVDNVDTWQQPLGIRMHNHELVATILQGLQIAH